MSTDDTTNPRPAAVPYLAVRGAREAIDWYGRVLGAVVEGATPDDRDVYEGYGTDNAWFVDPFGHRWGISGPVGGEGRGHS